MAVGHHTYKLTKESRETYMLAIFAAGLLVLGFHFLGSVAPTQDPILSAVNSFKTVLAAPQQ